LEKDVVMFTGASLVVSTLVDRVLFSMVNGGGSRLDWMVKFCNAACAPSKSTIICQLPGSVEAS